MESYLILKYKLFGPSRKPPKMLVIVDITIFEMKLRTRAVSYLHTEYSTIRRNVLCASFFKRKTKNFRVILRKPSKKTNHEQLIRTLFISDLKPVYTAYENFCCT